MTTTTALTTEQTIALLRHLTAGKTVDQVAVILHTTPHHVTTIAETHGWPDKAQATWAADILAEKTAQAAAHIPTRTPIPPPPPRPERLPSPAAPGVRNPPPTQPPTTAPHTAPQDTHTTTGPAASTPLIPRPDEIRVLLNTAKNHPSKRIQAHANRIFDALDRLTSLIREDQDKHAARREADRARAAAKADVDRLKKELAAAQAKVRAHNRGYTTLPTPTPTHPPAPSSEPPATKGKRTVTYGQYPCPTCDRTFTNRSGVNMHRNSRHSTCRPAVQAAAP